MNNRILIVTQYFYPENFKSNDIAFELAKKGFVVDALVSIPNYPEGKYFKHYGIFQNRIQKINGVKIFRAFQTPRGKKTNGFSLSLNYLTYAFCASLIAIFLSIFKKYDKIIVYENSPITQAFPALIINFLRKTPYYIWVQDLWPDAMESGGGVKNKHIINFVDHFVKIVYNRSAKIMISSKGFFDLIKLKGNYEKKMVYLPNWSEDVLLKEKKQIPGLPKGYIIMMTGNLGTAQRLDIIMKAVIDLKDLEEIKWIFIGDGSRKQWLDNFIKENKLENTVFALGQYSFDFIPAFLSSADALLLTLKAEFPHLRAVVPSRLQTYLAAGKPILAMIDGGAAEIIKESDCGYCVDAEDYLAFEEIIRNKVLPFKEDFLLKGQKGRRYYEEKFTKEKGITNLISILYS